MPSGSQLVGRDGARFSVGPVTLEFPDGAVAAPVRITVMPSRAGDLVDPRDETGQVVPTRPQVYGPVRIGPVDLPLSRSIKIMFAAPPETPGVTLSVARVAPLAGQQAWAWLPLSGQRSSPGLLWTQTAQLGVFGLIALQCCSPPPQGGARCAVACDTDDLRYRCDASDGQRECCDPLASPPQQDTPAGCP